MESFAEAQNMQATVLLNYLFSYREESNVVTVNNLSRPAQSI